MRRRFTSAPRADANGSGFSVIPRIPFRRALERPGTRLSAIEMLEAARQRESETAKERIAVKIKV